MRVLVVQGRLTDADAFQQYLGDGDERTKVYAAWGLTRALEILREHSVDAIILDLSVHGSDAVRCIREVVPATPIVVVGEAQEESIATGVVQAGAQDYLIKADLDEGSLRRALRYAIERQQLVERLSHNEATLQEENMTLRRLIDIAGRVFSTLDVHAVVALLAAEARRLWGGQVRLYTLHASGGLVCVERTGESRKADEFLNSALMAEKPVLSSDRTRLALPIAGSAGRNEWILDITSAAREFGQNDVFALELLRRYVGIALQNVALFRELQSQRASVIQLNQLKDDLIAVLAHDFKGPLTTIIGFTELLEQHALEGEDAQDALRTMRNSATRLAGLATDTLALSRVEQGELNVANDPVNVTEIIEQTAEELRSRRKIELNVQAQAPVVRGDPARLRQVFENIIDNAIKYSPGGEPVNVRVSETDDTVRVVVQDRGIGVPADEMRFLFERFTRASNAKRSRIEGTGVGLYLAKTLVDRHGGNIQVQSQVHQGSAFTIVLPRMRDGVGGVLRIVALTADENLGPYMIHELRAQGMAARRDKTLTALLERLRVESADIVIVDRDTVVTDMSGLFSRARSTKPRVGLIRIGPSARSREINEEPQWDATLPNPFLRSNLQQAIAQVNRSRFEQRESR